MDSDFLLIQKMKNGEEQAMESFVNQYYPKILKYCCFHLPDTGDAEDITQETFEQFFRSLHQYRHYGKALNYLYVIASNQCKNYYGKRRELAVEELPEQLDCSMKDLPGWIDLKTALNTLPPELKETAILFFFQQMKQKEIAKILGIGLPLVKYRVKRAKELLASYLGKEELL